MQAATSVFAIVGLLSIGFCSIILLAALAHHLRDSPPKFLKHTKRTNTSTRSSIKLPSSTHQSISGNIIRAARDGLNIDLTLKNAVVATANMKNASDSYIRSMFAAPPNPQAGSEDDSTLEDLTVTHKDSLIVHAIYTSQLNDLCWEWVQDQAEIRIEIVRNAKGRIILLAVSDASGRGVHTVARDHIKP